MGGVNEAFRCFLNSHTTECVVVVVVSSDEMAPVSMGGGVGTEESA